MTTKEALYKLSGLARDKYPNSSVEPLCLTIETALNRLDELEKVLKIIKDIMNCIDLHDELCARVKDSTYEFIKGWNE